MSTTPRPAQQEPTHEQAQPMDVYSLIVLLHQQDPRALVYVEVGEHKAPAGGLVQSRGLDGRTHLIIARDPR